MTCRAVFRLCSVFEAVGEEQVSMNGHDGTKDHWTVTEEITHFCWSEKFTTLLCDTTQTTTDICLQTLRIFSTSSQMSHISNWLYGICVNNVQVMHSQGHSSITSHLKLFCQQRMAQHLWSPISTGLLTLQTSVFGCTAVSLLERDKSNKDCNSKIQTPHFLLFILSNSVFC